MDMYECPLDASMYSGIFSPSPPGKLSDNNKYKNSAASPMESPQAYYNTTVRRQPQINRASASQLYNGRTYQESYITDPQPSWSVVLPQSATDLLARNLRDEFQHSLSQGSETPFSLPSRNVMTRNLEPKESVSDVDTYGDSELDISLEHETTSVGSSPSGVSDHGYEQNKHINSNRHTAQVCRGYPKPATTHVQPYKPYTSPPATCTKALPQQNKDMNHPYGAHTDASNDAKPLWKLPPPINTTRLRPIREKTKNAVVNILNDGWVCLEFFKANDQDNIKEVVKISPDGLTIQICQPHTVGGANTPVKVYSYDKIPQQYIRKYQYAAKFVTLVKSRTPKVTLYTKRAKCILMENNPQPDFEVLFYDGAKCCQTAENKRIITKDGTTFTLTSVQGERQLSQTAQELHSHMQECEHLCKQLETILECAEKERTGDTSYFPITVGRRPAAALTTAVKNQVAAPCINQPQKVGAPQGHGQLTQKWKSSTASTQSSSSTNSKSSKSQQAAGPIPKRSQSTSTEPVLMTDVRKKQGVTPPSSQISAPVVLCEVFVQGIGYGRQLSNGEVSVQFLDGSEIAIQANPMVVRFSDNKGYRKDFLESDQLPMQVRQRLEMLPGIMLRLQAANSAAKAKMGHK